MARRPTAAALVLVVVAWVSGCAGTAGTAGTAGAARPPDETPVGLTLTSPDLETDGRLPAWATATVSGYCTGENRSPELAWTGAPDGVESFVVTLVDSVAPEYVHWVVTDIPADADGLARAADGAVQVGVVGSGFAGDGEYRGPCVPGRTYTFHLYALDTRVEGDARTDHEDALALVEGHVLAHTTLDVQRTP